MVPKHANHQDENCDSPNRPVENPGCIPVSEFTLIIVHENPAVCNLCHYVIYRLSAFLLSLTLHPNIPVCLFSRLYLRFHLIRVPKNPLQKLFYMGSASKQFLHLVFYVVHCIRPNIPQATLLQ